MLYSSLQRSEIIFVKIKRQLKYFFSLCDVNDYNQHIQVVLERPSLGRLSVV